MIQLYESYKDRVDFLTVYIVEAHPRDKWMMYKDLCVDSPKTPEERLDLANAYIKKVNFTTPLVVDVIEDTCASLYAAWPERLYVIKNGIVAYKGGTGPYNYSPNELSEWLRQHVGA